ncbi:MAG TPA: S1 RNA-binding domain-containing protein [Nitrososphaeria archaeon]|nr:S1 RNA-binding domain-containing protein [Nitrososphaeria archaeon]
MAELVRSDSPEIGELVIGVVKRVERYGVYVDLVEYPGWEGFVHISEISLKWVRNIRDYLRERQREVFKVLRMNVDAKQADISLRRVSKKERTQKLLEWKRTQRVMRVLHLLAERSGRSPEEINSMLVEPAAKRNLTLYDVFLDILDSGKLPTWMKLDKNLSELLLELIKKEIKLKKIALKATLKLSVASGNGVEVIRKAIKEGLKVAGKGENISITAIGSPRYLIRVEADEESRAKELLEKVAERCIEIVREAGGKAELVMG